MNNLRIRSQVLVIGSGLAGCSAALSLADKGFEVHLLVPSEELDGGNSSQMIFLGRKKNNVHDDEEHRGITDIIYFASAWQAK